MTYTPMRYLQRDLRAHVAALQQLADQISSSAARGASGQLDPKAGTFLRSAVELATYGSLLADELTDPEEDDIGRLLGLINKWTEVAKLAADLWLTHANEVAQ